MAPEFALSEESLDDERHVVAVRGEIDLFTAPDLKSTLLGAIDCGQVRASSSTCPRRPSSTPPRSAC